MSADRGASGRAGNEPEQPAPRNCAATYFGIVADRGHHELAQGEHLRHRVRVPRQEAVTGQASAAWPGSGAGSVALMARVGGPGDPPAGPDKPADPMRQLTAAGSGIGP